MSNSTIPQVIRWVARGASVLAAGFVLLIVFGEGGASVVLRHPGVLWLLFPVAALAVAWRWEFAGGVLAFLWLPAFYIYNWAESGRFPSGPWFALVASPSVLFLLGWFLTRLRQDVRQ